MESSKNAGNSNFYVLKAFMSNKYFNNILDSKELLAFLTKNCFTYVSEIPWKSPGFSSYRKESKRYRDLWGCFWKVFYLDVLFPFSLVSCKQTSSYFGVSYDYDLIIIYSRNAPHAKDVLESVFHDTFFKNSRIQREKNLVHFHTSFL